MTDNLDLTSFLPFRLNRLSAEMSRRLFEIYGARYGIDIPEWRVLATLGAREPVTAQEVVRSTHTHKSTISRAVARLTDMGWIERTTDDGDRRQMKLRFTAKGRSAYREIVPLVLEAEQEVLARLGGKQAAVRAALLQLETALDLGDED
ncbi:MAG: MarR family transcriptional regulator [Nitratireductor sp.]|nr:MarR family transcriptional regulator [Nitratireductor sp.]